MAKGRMFRRVSIVLVLAVVVLGILGTWFFGNFFYDLLWVELERRGYSEARVIAAVTAHLVPFVLATVIVIAVYFYARHELRLGELKAPTEVSASVIASTVSAKTIERDVPLTEAIDRAFLGTWKRIQRDERGGLPMLDEAQIAALSRLVVKEFQQVAFDGKLPVWGRKHDPDVLEKIPTDDWKKNYLDWFSYLRDEPSTMRTVQWITGRGEVPEWKNLWTSRVAVDRLWTRPSYALNPLRIVVAEGASFEDNIANPQRFVRRIGVLLVNTTPWTTARNCALSVTGIDPNPGWTIPRVLKDSISVDPGGRFLVPLVSYRESGPVGSGPSGEKLIEFGSVDDVLDGSILVDSGTVFALRVTATDMPYDEARVKAWIEDDKLRIKRLY